VLCRRFTAVHVWFWVWVWWGGKFRAEVQRNVVRTRSWEIRCQACFMFPLLPSGALFYHARTHRTHENCHNGQRRASTFEGIGLLYDAWLLLARHTVCTDARSERPSWGVRLEAGEARECESVSADRFVVFVWRQLPHSDRWSDRDGPGT
jgi:hypothetical protein